MTDRQSKMPVAILISGRGSNMLSLIEACENPDYPARIVVVISDREEAGGLASAQTRGIPALALPRARYDSREAFEAALDSSLRQYGAELVCLAGFMRILSAAFIDQWRGRILNIHPSLLPDFKGLNTHRRALEAGCEQHGCSVHIITPEMDEGPILGQAQIPVKPDDDPETLAARVLEAEHRLYPRILAEFLRRHFF